MSLIPECDCCGFEAVHKAPDGVDYCEKCWKKYYLLNAEPIDGCKKHGKINELDARKCYACWQVAKRTDLGKQKTL
jgi:hypothetical protein